MEEKSIALRFFSLTQRAWEFLRGRAKTLLGETFFEEIMRLTGLRELKSRFWRFEKTLPDGSRIRYRPTDQCIIDEIYSHHAYGPAEAFKPGDIVVDAGGHIGVFALWAARRVGPSGRVLVFEPGPDNLALLRRNVAANGLGQIAVRPQALSERVGTTELYIAKKGSDNPSANTLFKTPGRKAVTIDTTTLDLAAEEEKLSRIDHLKIDIEGAELLLLKGAPKALAMTRRIIMEIHPEKLRPEEVLDLLRRSGFEVTILRREPHSILAEATKK